MLGIGILVTLSCIIYFGKKFYDKYKKQNPTIKKKDEVKKDEVKKDELKSEEEWEKNRKEKKNIN